MRSIFWVFLSTSLLLACTEKSGRDDPLKQVPNEDIVAGLRGDWSLRATVAENHCEGIDIEEALLERPTLSVDEAGCSLDEDQDLGVETTCRAGGERVGVVAIFNLDSEGCVLRAEESFLLDYAEEDELTGSGEFHATASESCPEGIQEQIGSGCRIRVNITGSRVDTTAYSVPYYHAAPSTDEPPSYTEPEYPSYPELDPDVSKPASPESKPKPVSEHRPRGDLPPPLGAKAQPPSPFKPAMTDWVKHSCGRVNCAKGLVCIFGSCVRR